MTFAEARARLAARDPRYARKFGGRTAPVPAAKPLPCVHLGAPAAPPNGLPTARTWSGCDHPRRPLGSPVCPCMGCGPRCPGYEVESEM